MSTHFDTLIIGGGNAGFGVSSVLAEAGQSIAFIEEAEFGGTCPNRGCTPKKVLVAAAASLDAISKASAHGISVGEPRLDWAALIDRKDDMIGFIPGAMEGLANKRGTVFKGKARFTGRNEVTVGDTVLTATTIIIATGSTPRPLPIEGAELMITSDEVLAQRTQPDSVVFVGGGVIALEFAHIYARAGTKVTILEVAPQLLPRLDSDAVDQLRQATEALGVHVETGVRVEGVFENAGKRRLRYTNADGEARTIVADQVINGAGRIANVAGLDLEAAGITFDGVRVDVHPHLQSTSNPAVWVVGDALVHTPQLSPVATHEGQLVGRNILNDTREVPDYSVLPSAVYTVPSFASVGLTEAQARETTDTLRVTVNDMTTWFSGKSYAEKLAWSKVLIDETTDRIIGAHLIGHNADDLIHTFAFAMAHGVTVSQLKSTIYAYPSFSSDIKNLL